MSVSKTKNQKFSQTKNSVMKEKIRTLLSVLVLFSSCLFVGAQLVPTTPWPIPVPVQIDHYSWALPLADLMSAARQSVRYVSGYTDSKTVLDSSKARWINFEFTSPRSDGVILAEDINISLATNQFDLIIAESENGFSGNINLADSSHQTLFNGGFWADVSSGKDVKVIVTYYLADKIGIPVPSDLQSVKITSQDVVGQQNTLYLYPQNGRLQVPTNIGHTGNVTATFADNSQINFNLANGLAESEKQVKVSVSGEFANTRSFPKGETIIVLGVEEWMLNQQAEYSVLFEPRDRMITLYSETPQRLAQSVRIRLLPDGVWFGPILIPANVGLKIDLLKIIGPPAPKSFGVWEAIFDFNAKGEKG